jgi:hypothetical protein
MVNLLIDVQGRTFRKAIEKRLSVNVFTNNDDGVAYIPLAFVG